MKYTFGLCSSRHEMPVDKFLFPEELDPTNFKAMANMAFDAIPKDADRLEVYITGLTAAILAVVDVCERRKIDLIAYHYNRETGEYLPQTVLTFDTCLFCGHRHSQYGGWYCPNCGST